MSKVLVESREGSNLLYLPLDKLIQSTGNAGGTSSPQASTSNQTPQPELGRLARAHPR